MTNNAEITTNRDEDTIYSLVDYTLKAEEKNLKLLGSRVDFSRPELCFILSF